MDLQRKVRCEYDVYIEAVITKQECVALELFILNSIDLVVDYCFCLPPATTRIFTPVDLRLQLLGSVHVLLE